MKTTAVVVELLIVGLLSAFTLSPFLALANDVPLDDILDFFTGMQLVPQLAIAYSLGILWNRFCNGLFFWPERGVQRKLRIGKTEYQDARITIALSQSPLNDYLNSYRGFIRGICLPAAPINRAVAAVEPALVLGG